MMRFPLQLLEISYCQTLCCNRRSRLTLKRQHILQVSVIDSQTPPPYFLSTLKYTMFN